MKDCTETHQENDDRAVIEVVSGLYLTGGLPKCARHAADVDRPFSETIASVRSTIEVAAAEVGHPLERLEQMEIRARLRPQS